MAQSLARLATPALSQVLDTAVEVMAEHGFSRVPGEPIVLHSSDLDKLSAFVSCEICDVSNDQRISVMAIYVLSQATARALQVVTGKLYLLAGPAGQLPLDRYDRTRARATALITETYHTGICLQPEYLADSVDSLARSVGPGANKSPVRRDAELVARVLVRSLEH